MRKILFILIVATVAACHVQPPDEETDETNDETNATEQEDFQRNQVSVENGRLSPEVLWSFGRLSGVDVSPDGTRIVFGVSYYSIDQNRGNRDLYLMNTDGSQLTQITETNSGEYSAVWRPDGEKIAFLSAESGSMQLWEMNPDGSERQQVTEVEGGISNFRYAPDGSKLLYTADVKVYETTEDVYPDLPDANARIIDDLMYRHWDVWEDEKFSHIFVADYADGAISNATDIMPGEPYDSPMKPWGGIEEIVWSPDGQKIAYTCKKLEGKDYALSTNSEIYLYDLNNNSTTNLSEGIMGYDKAPVFSPDSKKVVWASMERDGFEADKERIMVHDFETGERKNYSENFDQNASQFVWAADGQTLYFISGIEATYQIFSLNMNSGEIAQITEGVHNYRSVALAGEALVGTKQSMSMPTEIFSIEPGTGNETQLSFTNKELLEQIEMGKVEKRWLKTTDGKDMLTWIIYPPGFDPNKEYPALLYCQGGPQSAVSQFFSYRWNFQIMAANDYIIVAPNRRGLPTFGQEWNDQISKDYGGQNMKDLLTAIDQMKTEPFIDENRLGTIGASYGGYSVFWLAGNHEKRFKAMIAHCGIFNFESMYGSTEELFFVDWDMGGPYWDKEPKNSYDASPHLFVNKWDAPILIVHGGYDFRIPYTQAMNAFTAARMRGVPSRFLFFPEESHWVLSPQNGILWQREFFGWLDKYLKE